VNHHGIVTDYGAPVLVSFTETAPFPVGPGHRLTKFRTLAILEFGGSTSAAYDAMVNAVMAAYLKERP
jgi:hypothetical protein